MARRRKKGRSVQASQAGALPARGRRERRTSGVRGVAYGCRRGCSRGGLGGVKQRGGPGGALGGKGVGLSRRCAFECGQLHSEVADGGALGGAAADGKAGALGGEAAEKIVAAAATDHHNLGGLMTGVTAQLFECDCVSGGEAVEDESRHAPGASG